MNIPELTYRPFRRTDLPGVLRLWEAESGWGGISEQDFDVWYIDTPHGESIISVAVDDVGEVYGQEVFFPMRTVVEGRIVRSLHISAPILHASLREERITNKDHPVLRLSAAALQESVRQGYELTYATPLRAWAPFFRWIGRSYDDSKYEENSKFMTKIFGCAGRSVAEPLPSSWGGDRFAMAPTKTFGAEYDELWTRAVKNWPIRCGNVRDARWVDWRNGDHLVLEARDPGGDLAAYASLRQDGLVVDVLSRETVEITPVIASAVEWVRESAGAAGLPVPDQIKVMRHPLLEPAIEALGFEAVDFEFCFTCNTLGDTVERNEMEPDRWYVMPLY